MRLSVDNWCGIESGRTDDDGVHWTITNLEGWWDSPGARADFTARPQQPGAFDAPSYADTRVVTVEGRIGVFDRTNAPALQAARRRTQALLVNADAPGLLYVEENGQALQTNVRLSDKTTCDPVGAYAYDFSVQLTAPDPVRYEGGQPRQVTSRIYTDPAGGLVFPLRSPFRFSTGQGSEGRLALVNPGTAPTWPTFRIQGPSTGQVQQQPVLTAPNGDRLVYQDSLARGEYLVIDTLHKQVLLQGTTSRRYRMAEAEFEGFKIPAGQEIGVIYSTQDYPNPDSQATASWRPGWW